MTTRKVTVWYDERSGVEAGYVARCTEYDDNSQPVMGRIAMDAPIVAQDWDEARAEAAAHWGVDSDKVTIER